MKFVCFQPKLPYPFRFTLTRFSFSPNTKLCTNSSMLLVLPSNCRSHCFSSGVNALEMQQFGLLQVLTSQSWIEATNRQKINACSYHGPCICDSNLRKKYRKNLKWRAIFQRNKIVFAWITKQ